MGLLPWFNRASEDVRNGGYEEEVGVKEEIYNELHDENNPIAVV